MSERIHVLELRSVRGTGGGPEKTILLGTERADRERFAITVCYIRDLRDTIFDVDKRAERRTAIDYVEVLERHSFDRRVWQALLELVRDRQIDIAHAHDYKTDLIALLLARRTGAIPLATAHGWTGQSARERYLYYPVDKRLLARFPRVIAVSSEIRQELERHGARRNCITVILNAIDPVVFRRIEAKRSIVRLELGFDASHFIVGSVGRLERQKRFDLLIDAFAVLATRYQELRLVIAGDGSLRRDLIARAASCNIGDRCSFLGHCSDIGKLHHAFDVFVQSSEYEGTPNAVLEAMALETPLVATDVGGTSELATPGAHGLVVRNGDRSALQAAIESVLLDPESARFRATAARQRVEMDLSFEERTRRVERVYDELIGQRRGVHVHSGHDGTLTAGEGRRDRMSSDRARP